MHSLVIFVLDIETGRPASDISCSLQLKPAGGSFQAVFRGITQADGCVRTKLALPGDTAVHACRVELETGDYFLARHKTATFPLINIEFCWDCKDDMVLPVLISAHGYTTYRGY